MSVYEFIHVFIIRQVVRISCANKSTAKMTKYFRFVILTWFKSHLSDRLMDM